MTTLSNVIAEHKHICWYPSAATDFRPLVFLCEQYYNLVKDKFTSPINKFPDLFIFTDVSPWEWDSVSKYTTGYSPYRLNKGKVNPGIELYYDDKTSITIEKVENLKPLSLSLNQELLNVVDVNSIKPDNGNAQYMRVKICSRNNEGEMEWHTDIVYVIAENTAFAFEYLLPNKIKVDYLVNVRYGDAFGGSAVNSSWLQRILPALKTRYYLSTRYNADAPSVDLDVITKLFGGDHISDSPAVIPIYDTDQRATGIKDGSDWSFYGSVYWFAVNYD